jgi:hypothetical protein
VAARRPAPVRLLRPDPPARRLAVRVPPAGDPVRAARLIVNRFTDLLFAEGSHPSISIPSDQKTQEWVSGLVEAAHYWQRFTIARDMGGAMGSVAVGFKFVGGRPVIEVHDPRWCTPIIRDRSTWDLDGLEIRYMFSQVQTVVDDKGKPQSVEVWYWYRRTIDTNADTVYQPLIVDPERAPEDRDWQVDTNATNAHQFGFCPARWIQNLPNDDEVDGTSDCDGTWDAMEMLDGLMSQSAIGARANADPTVVFNTKDQTLDQVKKGTGNALRVEVEGRVSYLEIMGGGIKTALDVRKELKSDTLQACQCVLDDEDGSGQPATAAAVIRRYQAMFNKARRLREQYGEMGAKPLLEMLLDASRQLQTRKSLDPANNTVTSVYVSLPPLVANGELVDRTPGGGKFIDYKWPAFVEQTAIDAQAAATAASTARSARILDVENAVEFIAEPFGIEDVAGAVARLKAEDAQRDAQMTAEMLQGSPADAPAPTPEPTPPPEDAKNPIEEATIGELSTSLANLFKVGDMSTAEILRQALARKLGVPYLPPASPDELAAAAKPIADAMKGTPAPAAGGGFGAPGGGFGGGAPPAAPVTPVPGA